MENPKPFDGVSGFLYFMSKYAKLITEILDRDVIELLGGLESSSDINSDVTLVILLQVVRELKKLNKTVDIIADSIPYTGP